MLWGAVSRVCVYEHRGAYICMQSVWSSDVYVSVQEDDGTGLGTFYPGSWPQVYGLGTAEAPDTDLTPHTSRRPGGHASGRWEVDGLSGWLSIQPLTRP